MLDIDLTFNEFMRFLTKIDDYSDSAQCWNWMASRSNGYGQFAVKRVLVRAHRIAYSVLIGKIPDGLVLDHLCRNRSCVNPWHLEPVKQRDNTRRGDTGKHHSIKTHCPHGHEYTKENTIISKLGSRNCRACLYKRIRIGKQKRRATATSQ